MTTLPPKPDFEAIEAAAHESADRRTLILALIGNLVYSWSNNESLFIYVLMLLLETDEASAAVVFVTLNTTRARLELIQRLAKAKLLDKALDKELTKLIERFNECTRARNEFNHCMYFVDPRGEITHTQSIKVQEAKGRLQWSAPRPMDDPRLTEIMTTVGELRQLNRDIWDFLPRLQEYMARRRSAKGSQGRNAKPPPGTTNEPAPHS